MLTKTIHITLSESHTLTQYIQLLGKMGLLVTLQDDLIAVGRKQYDQDFTFYSYEGFIGFCDGIIFEKDSQKLEKEKGEK